jgi:hypothetical protein
MKRNERLTFSTTTPIFDGYHRLSEIQKKEIQREVDIVIARKIHEARFNPSEFIGRGDDE